MLCEHVPGELQVIGTRPALHQHRRDHITTRMRAPLAAERLTIGFPGRRRSLSRPLVRIEQADDLRTNPDEAAAKISERIRRHAHSD
jgi:hypothetical protein